MMTWPAGRRGGAYDRGAADSWYARGFHPHTALTAAELAEYRAGYELWTTPVEPFPPVSVLPGRRVV